ncbi:MAG: ATP-binding protein [Pseudomonadota bacterium]
MILLLASALYLGTHRAAYHHKRSYLAEDVTESYLQVSHHAYRHYKELVDIVVLEGDVSAEQAGMSYRALRQALDRLRAAIHAEVAFVKEGEYTEERKELDQVVFIEQQINQGISAFERVITLQRRGSEKNAQQALREVLERTIDRELGPLLDAAIAEERVEMAESRQRALHLQNNLERVAAVTALVGCLLAVTLAVWLWRSLSSPLYQLVTGVRQVAKGDLTHRIVLPGRNEFTYVAKNFNDMTSELAEQRKALLHAQAELEEKVDTRTRELQLANAKLQQIDVARKRFFADISHELRTPLTAIRGEAEVATRGKNKTTAEYREALTRIVEMAGQMGKLVEDLLFMARSDVTGMRFELKSLALNQIISELCDEAQALVWQHDLQLHLALPPQNVQIHGDRQRLRQALLILIDNACRYSKPGGSIAIELRSGQGEAIVTVSDEGIGIAPDELASIFERFYRGEEARNWAPAGSGLGLPLAKSIVEAHQGRIEAASTLGQGTRVSITLPMIQ